MAQTVAIIPGWAEGSWHTKALRQALIKAGFQIEANTESADIVIAHSGGCYILPNGGQQCRLLLVGPPYWPGKSLLVRLFQKVGRDFKARTREHKLDYFFRKSGWSLIYLLLDLPSAVRLSRTAKKRGFQATLGGNKAVIVRNLDDAFVTPKIRELAVSNRVFFFELPGEHDDLWINPGPYVAIIMKTLGDTHDA